MLRFSRRDVPFVAMLLMLSAGFGYSGWMSVREYAALMQSARPAGDASDAVNGYLLPLNVSSMNVVREAVGRPGWASARDISLVTSAASTLSAGEITQVHFALGYALYPRRIWLRSREEAIAAARDRGQHHAILVGSDDLLSHGIGHPMSEVAHLVELP